MNEQAFPPEALAKALRDQPEPTEPELDRALVGLLEDDELPRVLAMLPSKGTA